MAEFIFDKVTQTHSNGVALKKPSICCNHCGQKAFFYASQVNAQGKVSTQAFCLHHAFKAGLMHPRAWDLLNGGIKPEVHTPEVTCQCGMTHSLLKSKGRMGCAMCYTTFASTLKPVLPKLHNATAHAGKTPASFTPRTDVRRKVKILEMAMQRAIRNESYEAAAMCRDSIRELTKSV